MRALRLVADGILGDERRGSRSRRRRRSSRGRSPTSCSPVTITVSTRCALSRAVSGVPAKTDGLFLAHQRSRTGRRRARRSRPSASPPVISASIGTFRPQSPSPPSPPPNATTNWKTGTPAARAPRAAAQRRRRRARSAAEPPMPRPSAFGEGLLVVDDEDARDGRRARPSRVRSAVRRRRPSRGLRVRRDRHRVRASRRQSSQLSSSALECLALLAPHRLAQLLGGRLVDLRLLLLLRDHAASDSPTAVLLALADADRGPGRFPARGR